MTPKYPIGVQDFADLRSRGFVYVDKTEHIYRLVGEGKYYFLSRPRRFGKSLLISTIKYLFQGRRDLFDGLWIAGSDFDWTPRPVFHIDLANIDPSHPKYLEMAIDDQLSSWEGEYGLENDNLDFSRRFYNLLRRAAERTGRRCVVLIDEYDKTLVNNLERPELHDAMRVILRPLYSNLKAADEYIHFGMLTGVSRFSKLSIFSDLNNLLDISLSDDFAEICGVTESELLATFTSGIEALAQRYGSTGDDMLRRLKQRYDGYHFAREAVDIYNPYSLICAFRDRRLGYYWFSSATASFIVRQIQSADRNLQDALQPLADGFMLETADGSGNSLTDMLFQTGYLTIKSYDWDTDTYKLGIPNREVERGLFQSLLPLYSGKDDDMTGMLLGKMRDCLLRGDADRFVEYLQGLMAGVGYDLTEKKKEIYFENNLYLIFKLLGLTVQTEFKTSAGRCDVVVTVPGYVYVIELKLGKNAAEAMAQINERGYALPFKTDSRRVIKIGINISPQTRTVDDWTVEAED